MTEIRTKSLGETGAVLPAQGHDNAPATSLKNIRPPPELLIEGDLVLRRWQFSDAEDLNAAATSSATELARWMPWATDGYNLTKAREFLDFTNKAWRAGETYDFAIIVDGLISGSSGLMKPGSKAPPNTLEVGYWLAIEATGRGYATRAASILTRTAFEMGAEHVQIRHAELNHRSSAIPRRLAFKPLGLHNLPAPRGGGEVVSMLWQKDLEP
ncbi:hypothetical protein ED733_000850 [Metarhizium rileyi]|uniref:N-acetyltransferase domain-containing protein n=1 Tax=Metarhizium rileyi (strain RCEF 4871) TaxID=1649241 RepID=A0A5C6G6F6_METRR|nr:hypothetical protein ED733_000850 [Metarhizium rileyi]